MLGPEGPSKIPGSHIDASHSRQPLVKGERLVRYEVNAVMPASRPPFLWREAPCAHVTARRCLRVRFPRRQLAPRLQGPSQYTWRNPHLRILAEGAVALPVTLSGGALFAS